MKKEAGRDDFEPEMPDTGVAGYLISYLFEVGPTMAGGMGAGPLTHGEILAWQEITGTRINTWEARTLRRLSLEYLSESCKATKRNCPPPWKPDGQNVISLPALDTRNAIRALAAL
jgi:hypothetical protein